MALTMEQIRAKLQAVNGVYREPVSLKDNHQLWLDYTYYAPTGEQIRSPVYYRDTTLNSPCMFTGRDDEKSLSIFAGMCKLVAVDEQTYLIGKESKVIPLFDDECYGINTVNIIPFTIDNERYELFTFYRVDQSTDREDEELCEPKAFQVGRFMDVAGSPVFEPFDIDLVAGDVGSAEWQFGFLAHGGATWRV